MAITTHAFEVRHTTAKWGATVGGQLLHAVWGRIAGIIHSWFERRVQYLAIQQLRALDNRMLKDIGLERSQIVSAVIHGLPRAERDEDQSAAPTHQ